MSRFRNWLRCWRSWWAWKRDERDWQRAKRPQPPRRPDDDVYRDSGVTERD